MAQSLLVVGLIAILNLGLVGAWLFLFDEESAAWITVITAAVYAVSAGYYFASGNGRRALEAFLWISVANHIGVHISLGGFAWSGTWIAWGVLVTATSALFFGRRYTLVFGTMYIVLALIFALVETPLRSTRTPPATEVSTFLLLDMFIAVLLMLSVLTVLLVEQVVRAQARANSLLLNVLPADIARRLKDSPGVIADHLRDCTVLFADIVGFTEHTNRVSPERLVDELNHVFSSFDALADDHGVEKIKTIGDGYMAAAGAPLPVESHVESTCDLALSMQAVMPRINKTLDTDFRLRVGICSGDVVAGVIGASRLSYDLWGDTVNVASRMESQGKPGMIQVTESVVERAPPRFAFQPGGTVDVRGRGRMRVFHLTGSSRGAC